MFKMIILFRYNWFSYELITSTFSSNEQTKQQVVLIEKSIIDKLKQKFR
jgi:hypothetical protein